MKKQRVAVAMKLLASGGYHPGASHDWLMSDGSVQTMTSEEAAAINCKPCFERTPSEVSEPFSCSAPYEVSEPSNPTVPRSNE